MHVGVFVDIADEHYCDLWRGSMPPRCFGKGQRHHAVGKARSEDNMLHLREGITRSSSGCVRASHDPRWSTNYVSSGREMTYACPAPGAAPTDPMLRAQPMLRGRLRCCVGVSVMLGKPERRGFAFLPVLAVGGTVVNGMRCIAVNSARASRGCGGMPCHGSAGRTAGSC